MVTTSVIIPAYNQGHYLRDAIQSVLGQTREDYEILVIDDGSTDSTSEVARSFDDPRLIYIYQENRGLSGARNTGIRNSHGKYLTFLDSDDLFLPDKLSLLIDKFEHDPDCGLVAGQAIPIDEEGQLLGKLFNTPIPKDPVDLLLGNPLHVGSVMLQHNWQEKVGWFDEGLRSYEDWDMWLRLGLAGCKTGWVDKPVSYYRFHAHQMTRIGSQMTKASFTVLDKIYSDPDLPENWIALHDLAYSNAHLRAAAQDYKAEDYPNAQEHLILAIQYNPQLIEGQGECLANRFIGWIDLPKIADPLEFLTRIYDNLPESLSDMRRKKGTYLGSIGARVAFEAYRRGDIDGARKAILMASKYKPELLLDKGIISILVRSSFRKTSIRE
jgi:glycosyltransferase involved in cell wall biosynthesis